MYNVGFNANGIERFLNMLQGIDTRLENLRQ